MILSLRLMLVCSLLSVLGCRSQDRNTYFSDLRSESSRNESIPLDKSKLSDFDGLILIALESIDTSLATILAEKGFMPGFLNLMESGRFTKDTALRFSSEKYMLGMGRLEFETNFADSFQEKGPNILFSTKFSFSDAGISRKNSSMCLPLKKSLPQDKDLFHLQIFQPEIRGSDLCFHRNKLEKFIKENTLNTLPETLVAHIGSDILFSKFVRSLSQSTLKNSLLLTIGTIPLIEPTKVQVTPNGEVSASGKILVQKLAKKAEKLGQVFAPLQFIRSNGKDDLAFAEIAKLSINKTRLIDYFSSVQGDGLYLVPWDLHQNQDHLTTQLIVDHSKGRRSKIELDYGFNDRFKHSSVTPIGAIDIEELTEYEFGYLTEEEWLLLGLRERNNEMRLIPGLGQAMLFSQEVDAGFLFSKSDFFKSTLFSFTTLAELRGKEESLSQESLLPTPTLRSMSSLISEWQQSKKKQDPKILN